MDLAPYCFLNGYTLPTEKEKCRTYKLMQKGVFAQLKACLRASNSTQGGQDFDVTGPTGWGDADHGGEHSTRESTSAPACTQLSCTVRNSPW